MWVLVRTRFWAEIRKISEFFIWRFSFLVVKFSIYLNRHVSVMARLPLSCSTTHSTVTQRWNNIYKRRWLCINVETTLFHRCVPSLVRVKPKKGLFTWQVLLMFYHFLSWIWSSNYSNVSDKIFHTVNGAIYARKYTQVGLTSLRN